MLFYNRQINFQIQLEMKAALKSIFSVAVLMLFASQSWAQCAMCRSTLEANMSNGETAGLAAGLNFGILYLFATPYLMFGIIAFFWYKNSKANGKKVGSASPGRR